MFKQSNNKFSIFANNLNIFRTLDCDSTVAVTSLVESDGYLSIDVVSNCKLTFTSIALFLGLAGHKLIQGKLFEFLSVFDSFCHFVVFVKLPVVVFNYSVYIFHLCRYLLFISHIVQRRHDILNLRISHLLPILLSCLHFSFLCWFCAVLNTDELCLVVHHPFLGDFHLHPLVFGES